MHGLVTYLRPFLLSVLNDATPDTVADWVEALTIGTVRCAAVGRSMSSVPLALIRGDGCVAAIPKASGACAGESGPAPQSVDFRVDPRGPPRHDTGVVIRRGAQALAATRPHGRSVVAPTRLGVCGTRSRRLKRTCWRDAGLMSRFAFNGLVCAGALSFWIKLPWRWLTRTNK